MKRILSIAIALLIVSAAFAVPRRKHKKAISIGWAYAARAAVPVLPKPGDTKSKLPDLERGSLAHLMQEKHTKGEDWWKVAAINPATLLPFEGWARASSLTDLPDSRFPADSDLLTKMGQPFLDDFVASHTVLARFLVRRAGQKPLLLCYAESRVLPQARLQVFRETNNGWVAGPSLNFAFAEMDSPVTRIEIRDLFGNHDECVVTTEVGGAGVGASLRQMLIRRITGDSFQTLWKAPLKMSELDSYPAQIKVLSPPVRNIGRPGTVTIGTVSFEPEKGVNVPVWSGKVKFFAIGRDKPVKTISVHKTCSWTGDRFEPLR